MDRNPNDVPAEPLEQQIEAWRAHLRRSRTITPADAAELEDHLREQIASLGSDGLSEDEAFLVAVKRMGAIDALTREFAREHSDRLWKQLVLSGDGWDGGAEPAEPVRLAQDVGRAGPGRGGRGGHQAPGPLRDRVRAAATQFYPLNIAFFTLPFIVAYFAWERPLPRSERIGLAAVFAVAAIVGERVPLPPSPQSDTQILTIIHLPIALWLAVGVAYVGGRWRGSERRMDFVRFTGRALHLLRADRAGRGRADRDDVRPVLGHRDRRGAAGGRVDRPRAAWRAPRWSRRGWWRRSRA